MDEEAEVDSDRGSLPTTPPVPVKKKVQQRVVLESAYNKLLVKYKALQELVKKHSTANKAAKEALIALRNENVTLKTKAKSGGEQKAKYKMAETGLKAEVQMLQMQLDAAKVEHEENEGLILNMKKKLYLLEQGEHDTPAVQQHTIREMRESEILTHENNTLTAQVESLQKANVMFLDARASLADEKKREKEATKQNKKLLKEVETLTDENKRLRQDNDQLIEQQTDLNTIIDELSRNAEDAPDDDVEQLKARLAKVKAQATDKLGEAAQSIIALKQNVVDLHDENEALKQSQGEASSVSSSSSSSSSEQLRARVHELEQNVQEREEAINFIRDMTCEFKEEMLIVAKKFGKKGKRYKKVLLPLQKRAALRQQRYGHAIASAKDIKGELAQVREDVASMMAEVGSLCAKVAERVA